MPRRLPAPWKAERIPGGYVVRDANGQAVAYVYSRANEAEAMQAKVLTDDEGWSCRLNIRAFVPCPRFFGCRLRIIPIAVCLGVLGSPTTRNTKPAV